MPELDSSVVECLAEAAHQRYVRSRLSEGADATAPELRSWCRIGEAQRERNRDQVRDITLKLEAVGIAITDHPTEDAFVLSAEEFESLSRLEHERWAANMTVEGWVLGPRKNPKLRTHPSLVDYDLLSNLEKDKDREVIARIPELLAAAGLGFRRARD